MTESEVDGPQPVDDEPVPEWKQRLLRAAEDHARRRAQADQWRAEFAERRQHGLAARHRQKLARKGTHYTQEGQMIIPVSRKPEPDTPGTGDRNRDQRVVCCRYRRRNDEMCTGEALDPDGPILLCLKHAGRVMQMIAARAAHQEGQP